CERAQRLAQSLALDTERHRGALATRQNQTVDPFEAGGRLDQADVGAAPLEQGRVLRDPTLQRQNADGRRHQPRPAKTWSSPSLRASNESIALPRPVDASTNRTGSWKCVVASTTAAARPAGSSDLKIP